MLDGIEFLHSSHCIQIKNGHLVRLDLPFTSAAEMKPECNHLSENVEAFRENTVVKCRWKPGHFDIGFNAVTPKANMGLGFMHWRLCYQFHQKCEVIG